MREHFWRTYGTTLNGLMRPPRRDRGQFSPRTHVFPESETWWARGERDQATRSSGWGGPSWCSPCEAAACRAGAQAIGGTYLARLRDRGRRNAASRRLHGFLFCCGSTI